MVQACSITRARGHESDSHSHRATGQESPGTLITSSPVVKTPEGASGSRSNPSSPKVSRTRTKSPTPTGRKSSKADQTNGVGNTLVSDEVLEKDEFGLPIKKYRQFVSEESSDDETEEKWHDAGDLEESSELEKDKTGTHLEESKGKVDPKPPNALGLVIEEPVSTEEAMEKKEGHPHEADDKDKEESAENQPKSKENETTAEDKATTNGGHLKSQAEADVQAENHISDKVTSKEAENATERDAEVVNDNKDNTNEAKESQPRVSTTDAATKHVDDRSQAEKALFPEDQELHKSTYASQWSHQLAVSQHQKEEADAEEADDWQTMPAFAPFDLYDDDGKLIAREHEESDEEMPLAGGASKGYTRLNIDEDAQSASSMDENTQYLFKQETEDDDEARDILGQMQATKDMLTEGQRIAYVGLCRLAMGAMSKEVESLEQTRGTKQTVQNNIESTRMWSQKLMLRLYMHMEITQAEQVMIEQLSEHGVEPNDLTGTLMLNSRVKNPLAKEKETPSRRGSSLDVDYMLSGQSRSRASSIAPTTISDVPSDAPPPYDSDSDESPHVTAPEDLPDSKTLDIDLRWTVLCDLFLVLLADSVYDARSRTLLENVGSNLSVTWLEICKFEKRITDALEMQEEASNENWDENDHMDTRRKQAIKKRMVLMGLATVGGGLVIGLSAGLLAPVIGAGLAAGFTTIGVAGTGTFLAGAGGAAIITTTAAVSGGAIAVKASHRRTKAVSQFEYRPLHNNKRVNLIVTVSGWMNGKLDDVRLPFSTVDPIVGDIYSVLWEPDVLQSVGQTISILATEALTQSLQQVLGSTILVGLMAAIQLPIILTKLAYLIDNPWTVSVERATAAGLILADSLIDRNLGIRPVTLVGYSLGSRVIFACLKELAKKGAYGLVQNVYMFGAPVVAKKDEWLKARTVVSGRFVNAYATNDWILGM
jgi:hypothetical protein